MNAILSKIKNLIPGLGGPDARARFQAWWNGVEYKSVAANAPMTFSEELAVVTTEEPPAPEKPAKKKRELSAEAMETDDDSLWPSIRITLAQDIWGEGFCNPGGVDYVFSLAKNFSPVMRGMKLLDVNASLGGSMAWIAGKYEIEAEGLEVSESLQRAGKAFLAQCGLPSMSLKTYTPESLNLVPQSYDFILAREFLYHVADKKEFLDQLCNALKDRGQILFTDLVRVNPGELSVEASEWGSKLLSSYHFERLEEIKALLQARDDMEIRAIDDITPRFIKEISIGWRRYLERLSEEEPDSKFLPWILHEVEIWAKRIDILQAGELRLYRFYARRKAAMDRKPRE